MADSCFICDRVALWKEGKNPYFIAEFKHSIFVVGDHQYHKGYCLVLFKEHVRELHELPKDVQTEHFAEVMAATRALVDTFAPWKMNHASYGNAEGHVHWHLFPRYADDPDRGRPPFLHAAEFREHVIDAEQAKALAAQIRTRLS